MNTLKNCQLCPRSCGVDRTNGEVGFCGAGENVKIARAALHFWEEPCISGSHGSGTVFFSHCSLKCVYCQNYQISTQQKGYFLSIPELADIFLQLQRQNAHNINLVTPTHFIPQIASALRLAKQDGLSIPVVYNSSGYETVPALKQMEGLVDIYLPDFKYWQERYALRYSNVSGYRQTAQEALAEMHRQAGCAAFDSAGLLKHGMIVRHLMLPGLLFDSKKIIDYLYNTYKDTIYISIMSQYTPLNQVSGIEELNRPLPDGHYAAMVNYCMALGITNAYIQDGTSAKESFIPSFDGCPPCRRPE